MYADPAGRGGVLEPEGIVEIKFRAPDLVAAMHRLDPHIAAIKAEGGPDLDADLRAREAALLPVYRQVRAATLRFWIPPPSRAAWVVAVPSDT